MALSSGQPCLKHLEVSKLRHVMEMYRKRKEGAFLGNNLVTLVIFFFMSKVEGKNVPKAEICRLIPFPNGRVLFLNRMVNKKRLQTTNSFI